MKYQYGLLRVDRSSEADAHNARWLGPNTLGIEVTVAPLAARCGLGNIDPQHNPHGDGGSSAIEETLWLRSFPPEGACLVTDRSDKDSIGAMAVITLLAEKTYVDRELVSWVGLMDRVGFDNARKLVSPELLIARRAETDAMQVIVQYSGRWPTLDDKVREIKRIISSAMPPDEIAAIAALKERNVESFPVEIHGGVAVVRAPGKYDAARDWANKRYPVVIVCDPEYVLEGTKKTVYRWCVVRQQGVFDRRGFECLVNKTEATVRGISIEALKKDGVTWGGPKNIVSSPKGHDTALPEELIIALARECAESGVVS